MATEELKIIITADTSDALQDLQTVKKSVKELGASSGTDKLKSSMSGYSQATATLGAELKNIRNLQMADVFTHVTEALSASKDRMRVATSAFKEFGEELRGAFNFSNFDVNGPKELFQSMKIQGVESIKSLQLAFTNLGKAIKAVTSSAAFAVAKVLAVVVALVSTIKNGFSAAQRLTASFYEAQKIGMQHSSYQEWAYVMAQVGVEADKLSDFIKGLSAAQNDLRDGSEGMVEAFKALGLSAEEAANMTQEQLFTETIKRLQQMENQVERTGIAYRIFGEDDAAQLTNILNLNNQEMERMINNFYLLGGSASDSAIQKSRMLSAAVANLKLAWQGFSNTIGEAVMPALTAIVNGLTKAVVAINMFLRAVFGFSIVSKGTKSGIEGASVSVGGYTDSLNAATSAAEKLKRTTQGFDELNIVQNPNTSGGGGGGDIGGGGGGTIDIPSMDFEGLTQDLGLDEMAKWFEEHAEAIRKWTTVVVAATAAWKLFQAGFLLFTGEKIGLFSAIGAAIKGAVKAIPAFAGWLGTVIALLKEGNSIWAVLGAAFPKAAAVFTKIGTAIAGAAKAVAAFVGGLSASTIAIILAIIAAIASAVYFLWKNWDGVVQATKNWFAQNIAPKLEKIADSFGELWQALVSVWDALKSIGSVIWNAIPDSWKQFIIDIGTAIWDVVKAIGQWFASIDWLKAIGTVFEWLGGLVVGILGGAIGGAISGVIQLIQGAVGIVTGAVQVVSGIVSGLVNLIVGLFTGDFAKAKESADLIWTGIVNIFKGAYDATIGVVVEFVKGIIDWFTELWDVLVGHSIVPDMIKAIIKWFKNLPKQIFKVVADFVKKIIKYFTDLGKQAEKLVKDMWTAIKKVWDKVKDETSKIWEAIQKAVVNVWNSIKTTATTIFNAIKKFFSDTWNSIKSTATTAWNAIAKFFSDTWNSIKTTATNVWNAIKTFLTNLWNGIKTTATTIWNAVVKFFKDSWESIKTTATNAWNGIKTMLENAWNTIKTKASELCDKLKEFFSKAWDAIKKVWDVVKGYFQGIWDAIKTGASTLTDNVKNFFINTWNAIKGVWDTVKGYFQGIWDGIKNAASSAVESIKGFFSGAWTAIKNVWSGVTTWFSNIWTGIKNAFSGVGDWFGSIFSGAVTKVKNAWSGIKEWFSGVWSGIKGVFTSAGSAISDGITGALKSTFNSFMRGAVGLINKFIRAINSAIGVINKIPGVNISTLGELSVPQLAKGGIVTDSILANIGERGREAVLPLENNTGWMDALADRIAARNGPSKIVLQVDGRELGWATIEQINAITKQTGGLQLVL